MSRRLRMQDIVNDSLDQVSQMHPWEWLQGGYAYLDTRAQLAVTAMTWAGVAPGGTLTKASAFTSYNFVEGGDHIEITSGTGVDTGHYEITAKTDNAITLALPIIASGTPADVAGTIDPHSIALPSDFRAVIDLRFTWDNNSSLIRLTSPEAVAYRRANQLPIDDGLFRAAVSWAGDPVTASLQLAPTFGTNDTKTILCVYQRKIPYVSADSDSVLVPDWMHRLVKQVCRAIARGLEMGSEGEVEDRMAKVMVGPVFHNAVTTDGGAQEEVGQMRGGHAPKRRGDHFLYPGDGGLTIGGPTTP